MLMALPPFTPVGVPRARHSHATTPASRILTTVGVSASTDREPAAWPKRERVLRSRTCSRTVILVVSWWLGISGQPATLCSSSMLVKKRGVTEGDPSLEQYCSSHPWEPAPDEFFHAGISLRTTARVVSAGSCRASLRFSSPHSPRACTSGYPRSGTACRWPRRSSSGQRRTSHRPCRFSWIS